MRLLLIGLCVAAGSVGVAFSQGSPAHASAAVGCYGYYYPDESCTLPYPVPLTASIAYDVSGYHRVCAAALNSNGQFFSYWGCALGYVEHCYDGSQQLYGEVGSGDPNLYLGEGEEFWNVPCP